ncbi:response regulator [Pseudodesulfovibrio sp. zrk46]|uniref:response regulator n=1 Tax=Pseudodesulfovibrio sp. zrk46 TaxID=2725288 RepID=UPI0014492185|nr:response regulator [Pseudodesulfovibrio sp. zrk46]QJB57835.1 response regulator [Pseudodesulfovibrio sp. zrk46]
MSAVSFDPKIRILVVDDSSTMRRIICTALKDIGLRNIVTAEDGDEAWEKIQRYDFDLILSDHKMERVSGEELLRMVREDERYSCLPFIMITAEAFRDNVMKAVQLGVSNYIVKPFNSEQLRVKIEKVIGTIC